MGKCFVYVSIYVDTEGSRRAKRIHSLHHRIPSPPQYSLHHRHRISLSLSLFQSVCLFLSHKIGTRDVYREKRRERIQTEKQPSVYCYTGQMVMVVVEGKCQLGV